MKDGMDLVEENGSSPNSIRLMRFLMGFLFVLGLFLIEIGIAEIILGNDFRCRETARSARLALDPYAACLPEATHYFFQVLSRGPFAIVVTQIASPIAWLVTGTLYGFLGGFLAQFSPRMAIVIYSGVHVAALFIMTVLTFLSNFIA